MVSVGKRELTCRWCQRKGHFERDCRKKAAGLPKEAVVELPGAVPEGSAPPGLLRPAGSRDTGSSKEEGFRKLLSPGGDIAPATAPTPIARSQGPGVSRRAAKHLASGTREDAPDPGPGPRSSRLAQVAACLANHPSETRPPLEAERKTPLGGRPVDLGGGQESLARVESGSQRKRRRQEKRGMGLLEKEVAASVLLDHEADLGTPMGRLF